MVAIASNIPNGRKYYCDANGVPLAGGTVGYFIPNTLSPVVTYLDDAQLVANPNPIVLDAGGSCIAFGCGEFREIVKDSVGNTVSDTTVVANFPAFTASASSVTPTPTPTDSTLSSLNIMPGDQSLTVVPTANAPKTLASLNVQGSTISATQREFLVNLGLTSATGVGHAGGGDAGVNPDKVTLYVGLTANAGTFDTWTINSCHTMAAGSGSYNAQGYELDFNNFNAHRGNNGNLLADFTAPIANGMSITGASQFTSTAGLAVESQGSVPQWARGIVTLGTMAVCAYQEWTTVPVGFQLDGAYSTAAFNLTGVHGNAGAVTNTALFMKNSQTVSWQTADLSKVISDSVDVNNNRVIGLGSSAGATSGIIMCASTVPLTSGLGLGTAASRWGDIHGANIRLPNAAVVSWENATDTGFIFDYADASNNRVVGGGANTVYMAADCSPITAGMSLGSQGNPWGNVWSTNGIVTPSDVKLKTAVKSLASMLGLISGIKPIEFRWKNPEEHDDRVHFGFNADHIHKAFGSEFAGYRENEAGKWLQKDELIAVLWKGIQELTERVQNMTERMAVLEAR